MENFAFLILFACGFLGSGRLILNFLANGESLDPKEKFLFSLGLGVGFFEIFGLGLGFLGWLGKLGRWGWLGILGGLGVLGIWELKKITWADLVDWEGWKKWQKVLLVLIFLRLLLNFFLAQAPVTEGDALWVHLTLPKIFLRQGRITDVYSLFSYLSFNTEMLYLWAMSLKDEILAQNLSFLVGGVFMSLAVYFFCQKFFSKRLALLSAFIFIFTPLVSWESVSPTVDLFWSFFVFLAFWAFLEKCYRLGFVFLGLAFGTKSVLTLIPAAGLVFLIGFENLFPGALITFLLWLPYLLRSFLLTGNPIYPLFPQFFGSGGLETKVLVSLQYQFYEKGLPLWDFLTYWWRVSIFPRKFGPDIGPLYLVFGPLGLIFWRRLFLKTKKLAFQVGIFCLLFYTFWYFFSVHSVRYLLPIFPFLAILLAVTINYLIKTGGLVKFLTLTILVLFVPISFLTYFWSFEKYAPKLKYVFGKMSREEYLFEALPYTRDLFWLNKNLPERAKVLLFFSTEMRPFYLERGFVLGSILQREIDFSRPEKIKNEEEFLRVLKNHRITHIFAAPNLTLIQDRHLEQFRQSLGQMAGVKQIYQGVRGNAYAVFY